MSLLYFELCKNMNYNQNQNMHTQFFLVPNLLKTKDKGYLKPFSLYVNISYYRVLFDDCDLEAHI